MKNLIQKVRSLFKKEPSFLETLEPHKLTLGKLDRLVLMNDTEAWKFLTSDLDLSTSRVYRMVEEHKGVLVSTYQVVLFLNRAFYVDNEQLLLETRSLITNTKGASFFLITDFSSIERGIFDKYDHEPLEFTVLLYATPDESVQE